MSWQLTVEELAKATGGKTVSDIHSDFSKVGTDTRQDLNGRLFIALKGDSFDAHDFLSEAVSKGAKALLVHGDESKWKELESQVSIVQVEDTLVALQKLANFWRHKNSAQIIAITGSNGKTTTKEFTNAIIGQYKKVVASRGSYNNHWGVPLTLLDIESDTEVAVVEMGMNNAGEIKALVEIAEPDVVTVTNVGSAHIGNLGSQENLVSAKEEIYKHAPQAVQVFNLINEHTMGMYERSKSLGQAKWLTYSTYKSDTDVSLRVTNIGMDFIEMNGKILEVEGDERIPIFGRQNGSNIMASCALALAAGLTPEQIWSALPNCRGSWGRNQWVQTKSGVSVLFDGYNANPESMAILIKNFYEIYCEGKKAMVLGEMLELGSEVHRGHIELGETLGNTDVELVWFIGAHKKQFEAGLKLAGFSKTYFLSDTYEQTLATKFHSMLNHQDIVAIKGSRGVHLEEVLLAWEPENFTAKP